MWRQSSWKATWWIFYLRRDKRGKFFCFLLILYEWPSSQLSLSATAINFLHVKSSGLICYVPHQTTRLFWEPTFRDGTGALWKIMKGAPCSESVKCRLPSMISMKNLTKYFYSLLGAKVTRGHRALPEHSPDNKSIKITRNMLLLKNVNVFSSFRVFKSTNL